MCEKKRFIFGIFFIGIFLFLITSTSALGVSPAKREYNFEPGFEKEIEYNVFGVDPDQQLTIYAKSDLAQYVTFDRETLVGGGHFTAKIKLPEILATPGKNRLIIGVKEQSNLDEELVGTAAVGTSVAIQVVVNIYVPYPGQYLETTLTTSDVNVGEPIDFNLEVVSRGKEKVSMNPRIDIFDSDSEKVETLYFQNRVIESQETLKLKKTLDTINYNPGNYKAVATIDYGGLATSEADFRIGDLRIDIVNYTHQVPIAKLEKFDLVLESGWNDQIDGAYAEVVFLNNTDAVLQTFKTSTTSLVPWESKLIAGYFDSSVFKEGFYDANVTLFYYGKDQGKSSSEIVNVEFLKVGSKLIWYFIGGGGILIIFGLLFFKFFKKSKKNDKKKK